MEFLQDALVQWDKDKSTNVVSLADLKMRRNTLPRKGAVVKMKWGTKWWRGKIIAVSERELADKSVQPGHKTDDVSTDEAGFDNDDLPSDEADSENEMEDIPLAELVRQTQPHKKPGNFKVDGASTEKAVIPSDKGPAIHALAELAQQTQPNDKVGSLSADEASSKKPDVQASEVCLMNDDILTEDAGPKKGDTLANEAGPENADALANEAGPENAVIPTDEAGHRSHGDMLYMEDIPSAVLAGQTQPSDMVDDLRDDEAGSEKPGIQANQAGPENAVALASQAGPESAVALANQAGPENADALANEAGPQNAVALANEAGPENAVALANEAGPENAVALANQAGPENADALASQAGPENAVALANGAGPENAVIPTHEAGHGIHGEMMDVEDIPLTGLARQTGPERDDVQASATGHDKVHIRIDDGSSGIRDDAMDMEDICLAELVRQTQPDNQPGDLLTNEAGPEKDVQSVDDAWIEIMPLISETLCYGTEEEVVPVPLVPNDNPIPPTNSSVTMIEVLDHDEDTDTDSIEMMELGTDSEDEEEESDTEDIPLADLVKQNQPGTHIVGKTNDQTTHMKQMSDDHMTLPKVGEQINAQCASVH